MRLKFIFAFAVVLGFSFDAVQAQQTAKITSSGIGYLEYVPQDYNKNSNNYPIVIFLHGIGERGTTSTDPATLKSSVMKVTNVGLARYVKNGAQYPFILISPQLKNSYGTWPATYVMDVLNHVKKYLRVDNKRIYITGLSLGGFGTWTTLAAYPQVFAAAVPICSGSNTLSKACAIASENVALWGFHGTGDKVVSYNVTTKMINAVNACTPKPSPLAKTTLFSGLGHNIWDKVYNETTALKWMLGFTNGGTTSSPTTNNPPVVSAGSDKSLTLPTSETYIQGSASDSDGSIAIYKWTKISGASCGMGGVNGAKMRAYNLKEGTYVFRLTVKDNDGASKYDDVKVTVSSSTTTNKPPVVSAGSDKSLTLPTNETYIQGSASDSDGSIAIYKWTKVSGVSCGMGGVNGAKMRAYNLKEGSYVFRLTVKDNDGASRYDDVKVTVSSSSSSTTTNIAPIANAGSNRTTSSNSIVVSGSGTDKDGTIVSYKWTQYNGPSATLTNVNTPKVTVSNLREGKYYLRLTVTDDRGASDYDNMLLTVSKSTSTSQTTVNIEPIADAGPNKRVSANASAVKVAGSGYDKDGKIVSYKWTQYAGPEATLVNYGTPTVTVKNLDEGKYYLKLTVKDNDGAVAYDKMLIVVEES